MSSRVARIAFVLALLAVGFLAGRWPWTSGEVDDVPATGGSAEPGTVWTCSMHPQIRMSAPGECPICGMDLTPARQIEGGDPSVVLTERGQETASIRVETIGYEVLEHELSTVGRVAFSEPNMAHLTARAAGRVERLYADYTGVEVQEGDHLVDIYSPDLVVAQQEYLLSRRALEPASGGVEDERVRARRELAREKLLLLGVTSEQIAELEHTGKPRMILTVHAPIGGTVVTKNVVEQSYVETGDPLYDIADLSRVWLLAQVYEFELPWIARGQRAVVTLEALPGEVFEGLVAFIDPRVDEQTRTIGVRINLDNARRLLKPGMFADVRIRATLRADGNRAPSPLVGQYTCPMHPEIVSAAPGACALCGMDLTLETGEPAGPGELLAVPASAVLDSGARRIVWVEREPGRYEAAEVELGPRAGARYPVLAGLTAGDRVVVNGSFLLDSQAQIEGRPSLLFPAGLEVDSGAHAGHGQH